MMGVGYKVLVSGISLEISKDDIIGMFLKFGDMVTIFIDERSVKGQRCGYVVYQTKLECYRAISELNGQPPHYWDLRFGASFEYDDCSEGSEIQPELVSMQCQRVPERPQNHRIPSDTNTGRRRVIHGKDINWSQIVVEDAQNQGRNAKDTQMGKQVKSPSITKRENKLMINSLPESGVDRESQRYSSHRSQGTPHVVQSFSGCKSCGNPGDESCSECNTTYCSRKCQVDDWKRHKHECLQIKLSVLKSPSKGTSALRNHTICSVEEEEVNVLVPRMVQKTISERRRGKNSLQHDVVPRKSHSDREFGDRINEVVQNQGHTQGKTRGKSHAVAESGKDLNAPTHTKDEDDISLDSGDSSYEDLSTSCGENTVSMKDIKRTVRRKTKPSSYVTKASTLQPPLKVREENVLNNNDTPKSSKNLDCSKLGININNIQQAVAKEKISESALSVNEKLIPDAAFSSSVPKPVIETLDGPLEPKVDFKNKVSGSSSHKTDSTRCDMEGATPKKVVKASTPPTAVQKKPPSLLELKIEDPRVSRWDKLAVEWNLFSDNPDAKIVGFDLCTQQKKLPPDVFTLVKILSCVLNGEFWVSCVDTVKELEVIGKLLVNKKQIIEAPYKPSLGDYCCVLYEDSLYRSKVLSKKENEVLVFLIDCGHVVHTVAELVWELPAHAKNFYAQAIHVKMDERTPDAYLQRKEGEKIGVKPIVTVQEVTKVQMEGVLYAQEVFIPKLSSLPPAGGTPQEIVATDDMTKKSQWPFSVLTLLTNGHSIACTVLQIQMDDGEERDGMIVTMGFVEIASDLQSILRDLPNDCSELTEDPEFNPSVGDLVAAYCYGVHKWVRSIVLASGNMRWLVACFDFGIIEEVSNVREIPKRGRFREAFCMSAKCTVIKSLFPREDLFSEGRLELHSSLFGTVVKKEENRLECQLELCGNVVEELCTVSLEVWTPDMLVKKPKEDKKTSLTQPLEYVKLTPGCAVKLVSYFSCLIMYVQPFDVESKQLMDDLHNKIAVLAVENGSLKELPIKGKVYVCLYSGDLRYYRVVVNEVKDKSEIHVKYIDYGNEEKVPLSRLCELPSEFAEIPCYGVKIELKKDVSMRLNLDCQIYLSYLILENRELTLNFQEGNLKHAELFRRGHSLCEILRRFASQ